MRRILYITVVVAAMALAAASAQAAPPVVTATWVTDVGTTAANLRAEIDPSGQPTTYLFEYTTEADYRAKGFAGATADPGDGRRDRRQRHASSSTPRGLEPDTAYRFRAVATNNDGVTAGAIRRFTTRRSANRSSRCPTTAAGRWSPRSTKTAARSRASAATSAAA